MKEAGVQFHEGVLITFHLHKWFPKEGLLVLDDLMAEGGEDKEAYSPNIHITKISRYCTCVKTCFHRGNTPRVFPGTPTKSLPSRIQEIR